MPTSEAFARGLPSVEHAAPFRHDFKRVNWGAHGRGSDAPELVRIGSRAQTGL